MNKVYLYRILVTIAILAVLMVSSPVQADQLSKYHEFDDFEIKMEQAKDSSGNKVTENGSVVYNISINASYKNDSYPFVYPIELYYYDITGESPTPTFSDIRTERKKYDQLMSEVVYLDPTESENYVPKIGSSKHNMINKTFKRTLAFEDAIDSSSTIQKRVVFDAVSRHTDDKMGKQIVTDVDTDSPAGVEQGTSSEERGFNSLSESNYVSSYRLTESGTSGYLENMQLPSPSKSDLNGQIKRFSNMQQPNETSILSAGTKDLNMVTRNVISSKSNKSTPQTLAVSYNLLDTNQLTIDIINSKGEEIVEDTEYVLEKDPTNSDKCRSLTGGTTNRNLCTFTLSDGESDTISRLGEAYIHYQLDSDSTASIGCQSIISGYTAEDTVTCGYGEGDRGSSAVIGFNEFSGQAKSQSSSWQSGDVVLGPSLLPDEFEFKLDVGTAKGTSYNSKVRYIVAEDSSISGGKFTDKVIDDKFDMKNHPADSDNTFSTSNAYGTSDLVKIYYAYICDDTSSCTPTDYTEKRRLIFKTTGDTGFTLRASDPIADVISVDSKDSIVTRYRTKETTDNDYHTTRSDWTCIKGSAPSCSEASTDPNFVGTISERVIVENINDPSKVSKVRSGKTISEAKNKRSDLVGGGSWSVYRADLEQINREVRFAESTSKLPGNGWVKINPEGERVAQVDEETRSFVIRDGSSFRSAIGGTEKWYPIRPHTDQPSNLDTRRFEDDTKIRHQDPDSCLNCLTSETKTLAEERMKSSFGVIDSVIEARSGINIWEKESEEPYDQKDLTRNSFNYEYSDSRTTGQYRIFNNWIFDGDRSSQPDLKGRNYTFRNTDYERRVVHNWLRRDEADNPEFKRPEYKEVYAFERKSYNAEYIFEGDVTSPGSELYQYEKEVTDTTYTYNPSEPIWIDLSESTEDSEEIDRFDIKFDENTNVDSTDLTVDWYDSVHKSDPENLDGMSDSEIISTYDMCDSSVKRDEPVDSVHDGINGEVVVDECEDSSGDKVILRIGKKYDRPGVYTPRITMIGKDSGVESDNFDIYIDGENELEYSESSPELANVEAINDRTEYNIGVAAFKGQIKSNTANLDSEYSITISPADSVSNVGSCSEDYSGYSRRTSTEVTSEYSSGYTLIQTVTCELDSLTSPSDAKESFELYRSRTGVTPTNVYSDIPGGVVQSCSQVSSYTKSGTGQCETSSGTVVTIGTDSSGWSKLTAGKDGVPGIVKTCPDPYSEKTESLPESKITSGADTVVKHTCELDASKEFELRNRPVSVRYQSVGDVSDVLDNDCTNIPATSETGTHSGYVNNGDRCEKDVSSDPGPTDFRIDDIDSGAFRGGSLTTTEDPGFCDTDDIDSGIPPKSGVKKGLVCEYNMGGGVAEIRYGTISTGEWDRTSVSSYTVKNPEDSIKEVWNSEFIYDDGRKTDVEEPFTITINPRKTGIWPEGDREFTIELVRGSDGNDVVDSATATVHFCRSESVNSLRSLPKSYDEEYGECKDFDTLLTGEPDIKDLQRGASLGKYVYRDATSAVEDVYSSTSGSQSVYIQSPMDDACPYDARYPRGESLMTASDFQYTVDTSNNRQDEVKRLKEKVRQDTLAFYEIKGQNPCEELKGTGPEQTKNPEETLHFTTKTFSVDGSKNGETRDFIRTGTLGDLRQIEDDPAQSQWAVGSGPGQIGGLRLGNPAIWNIKDPSSPNNGVNDNLLAQYSFDHRPGTLVLLSEDSVPDQSLKADRYEVGPSVNGKIQDVAPEESVKGNERTLINSNMNVPAYNARLWFTTPCMSPSGGTSSYSTALSELPNKKDCPDGVLTNEEALDKFNPSATPAPDMHPAFLPVPPKSDTPDGSDPNINRRYYEDRYQRQDGVSAGSALELNDTSWLMITPPCIDRAEIGNSAGGTIANCQTNNHYRGGLKSIHDGTSGIHNLRQALDVDTGWSISFWVSTQNEDLKTVSENPVSTKPYKTVVSVGVPGSGKWGSGGIGDPPYVTESFSMNYMNIPERVDVREFDKGIIDSRNLGKIDYYNPESYNFSREIVNPTASGMAHDCLEDYDPSGSDKPPILCDIYIAQSPDMYAYKESSISYPSEIALRDSAHLDNLISDQDGVSKGDKNAAEKALAKELKDISREYVQYKDGFGWPASNRTLARSNTYSNGQPYPLKDTPDSTGCSTTYGQQKTSAGKSYSYNECFDTRYRMDGEVTNNGYENSDWRHVVMTYNPNGDRGKTDVYINGDKIRSDSLKTAEAINVNEGSVPAGIEPPQFRFEKFFSTTNPSCSGNSYAYGSCGPLTKQTNMQSPDSTIDSGYLYRDSTLSIGGQFYDASYTHDSKSLDPDKIGGKYRPFVKATEGNIMVDDVRIYNETLDYTYPDSSLINKVDSSNHRLDTPKNMFVGNISAVAETDDSTISPDGRQVSKVMDSAGFMQVSIGVKGKGAYTVDVIPCDSSLNCASESATVSQVAMGDSSLSGKTETVQVPRSGLKGPIEKFRFDVQLGSENIDESPVIRNIDITPTPLYTTCQKMQDGYMQSTPSGGLVSSVSGSVFNTTLVSGTGVYETTCDMETRDGGWTMYTWFEDGSSKPGSGLIADDDISKCELTDSNCFSEPNFTPPKELNDLSRYDSVDSNSELSDLNPQILIKAKNGDKTEAWAAFELSSKLHQTEKPAAIKDYLGSTREMSWVDGSGLSTTRTSLRKVLSDGETASTPTVAEKPGAVINKAKYPQVSKNDLVDFNTGGGSTYKEEIRNCLYPYATSENLNGRCITNYQYNDAGSTERFTLTERKADASTGSVLYESFPEYRFVDVVRESDGTVNIRSCLDRTTVDRCEIYYSTGDALGVADRTTEAKSPPDGTTYGFSDYTDESSASMVNDGTYIEGSRGIRGYVIEPNKAMTIDALGNNYRMGGLTNPSDESHIIGTYKWDGNKPNDIKKERSLGSLDAKWSGGKDSQEMVERKITLKSGKEYLVVSGGTAGTFSRVDTQIIYMEGGATGSSSRAPEIDVSSYESDTDIQLKKVVEYSAPSHGTDISDYINNKKPSATQDIQPSTPYTAPIIKYPDIDITIDDP